MSTSGQRFWINTVSLDHVRAAAEGGFTQADHGADTRLRQLGVGDGLLFYSPRTSLQGGETVQQFTALATVTGEEPYRVTMNEDFHPWRRQVEFAVTHPVAAKPLVAELTFIRDPRHWGLPFRRGLFTVPEEDFRTIAAAMRTH